MEKFNRFHRTLSSILAAALTLGSAAPSFDRGSREPAAGNGAASSKFSSGNVPPEDGASSSRSHALKPQETEQSAGLEQLKDKLRQVARATGLLPQQEPASPVSVRPEPVEGHALPAAGLEESPQAGQLGWRTVVGAFVELYRQFRTKNSTLGEEWNRADILVNSLLDPAKEAVDAGHMGLRLWNIGKLLEPFSERMNAPLETRVSLEQALTVAQEAVAEALRAEPNPSGLEEARNPFARGVVPPTEVLERSRLNVRTTDLIAVGVYATGHVGANNRDATDGLAQDIFTQVHHNARVNPHMLWFEGAKHTVYGEDVEYMVHEGGTTLVFPGVTEAIPVLADVTENTVAIIRGQQDKSGAGGTSLYLTGPLVKAFGSGKDEFGAAITLGAVPPDKMREFLPSQGGRPLDPDHDVISNIQRLLDANRIGWEQAEVFYQERDRSRSEVLLPLQAIQKIHAGMGLNLIKDGTTDGGLLSILGRKEGKYPVFVGTVGSTEGVAKYLNALIVDNVVVGFRLYSPFAKNMGDAVGSLRKTLGELTHEEVVKVKTKAKLSDEVYEALPKDVPIRYLFTLEQIEALREVRLEDAVEITSRSGKLFHNETYWFPRSSSEPTGIRLDGPNGRVLVPDVTWQDPILGSSFSVVLASRTLGIDGPKALSRGVYQVEHLVLERSNGRTYVWVAPAQVTWADLHRLAPRHFGFIPPEVKAAGLEEAVLMKADDVTGRIVYDTSIRKVQYFPKGLLERRGDGVEQERWIDMGNLNRAINSMFPNGSIPYGYVEVQVKNGIAFLTSPTHWSLVRVLPVGTAALEIQHSADIQTLTYDAGQGPVTLFKKRGEFAPLNFLNVVRQVAGDSLIIHLKIEGNKATLSAPPAESRANVDYFSLSPAPGPEELQQTLEKLNLRDVFWSAEEVDLGRQARPVLIDASEDSRLDRAALALSIVMAKDNVPEMDFRIVMPAARVPELLDQLKKAGADEVLPFLEPRIFAYKAVSTIGEVREAAVDQMARQFGFGDGLKLQQSGVLRVVREWTPNLALELQAFFTEGGLNFISGEAYQRFEAVLESA